MRPVVDFVIDCITFHGFASIMARICHTNNCPVGVATQQESLRAKFPGTPGDVVNYFSLVASEVKGVGGGDDDDDGCTIYLLLGLPTASPNNRRRKSFANGNHTDASAGPWFAGGVWL